MVFDFETGGLDSNKNPALEFAGIWLDPYDFKEITRYEAVIKPFSDMPIDEKALQANGITHEELSQGTDVNKVVAEIIERTEMANKGRMKFRKCVMVGHNVQFDIGFMMQIFNFTKNDMSKIFLGAKGYGKAAWFPSFFDTQNLAMLSYADKPEITSLNLSKCCENESIDLVDAHRAMNDTEATKDLFISYMIKMRGGSFNSGGKVAKFRDDFKFQI